MRPAIRHLSGHGRPAGKRPRHKSSSKAVAALEFALVAPLILMIVLAGLDAGRELLIYEQIHNAANAIAQAAEKLSVTTDPTTGAVTSELTSDQMQQAMSTIYAEIPGLNLGNGTGLFPDLFGVGLSAVSYTPLCSSASGCAAQTPSVLWTATLMSGGQQLLSTVHRSCSYTPQLVAHMPNNSNALLDLPSPILAGGTAITLVPQVVADVAYQFVPWFPFFSSTTMLYASASFPAPIGALDATVALNTSASTANVVSCG